MLRKQIVALTLLSLSVMFMAGCGSEIAMKFAPGDLSTYKSSYQIEQSVKLDMVKETQALDNDSSKKVEVTFAQEIQSVSEDSTALAKITIVDLKYDSRDSKGKSFSFDSSKQSDQKRPLNALIGKSYTINISTDGSVTPVSIPAVTGLKITGIDRSIARSLLSEKEIISRHEVPLPGKDVSMISPGKGWSRVVWSQKNPLAVKSFEKSYVLKNVTNEGIANVSMNAYETDKVAEGDPPKAGLFAIFQKAFETQEKYTGQMQIDIESGKVLKWNEIFDASYVVTEADITGAFQQNLKKNKQASDASMKMSLTYLVSLEKID